jgi:tetratricopeptide (TPR) repeat protein
MRLIARLFCLTIATASLFSPVFAGDAKVDALLNVSIKAEVDAKGQAHAAAGDTAYAAGKLEAALAAYGEGFAQTRDATFVYAMARVHQTMGKKDDAKAMFNMYLSAPGTATLKYKTEAEAELRGKAKGAVGTVVGTVKDVTIKVVDVGAGVYGAVKLGIAASVDASAKASAKAADEAYAAAKYEDAARGYLEAYAKSQQAVALYAAAQAKAQAGKGAEARGLLLGYIAAQPNGAYANDARTLLLAFGGQASAATKVTVKAKVSAEVKATAEAGDKAFAAGKFADAAKAYGEAYAKKVEPALLYAKGVALLYAGQTAEAVGALKAYLAAGGNLEFKASAEAHLRAGGAA